MKAIKIIVFFSTSLISSCYSIPMGMSSHTSFVQQHIIQRPAPVYSHRTGKSVMETDESVIETGESVMQNRTLQMMLDNKVLVIGAGAGISLGMLYLYKSGKMRSMAEYSMSIIKSITDRQG